ncbi:hypothetical protein LAD54_27340 [Klebsiella pneumoniae]|nr:hypothetical protein [Klebsiella pneumoniae]
MKHLTHKQTKTDKVVPSAREVDFLEGEVRHQQKVLKFHDFRMAQIYLIVKNTQHLRGNGAVLNKQKPRRKRLQGFRNSFSG